MITIRRFQSTVTICLLLASMGWAQEVDKAWYNGDEDMRYERFADARVEYLSGINDTDVNTRMAHLSGLIFLELWQDNFKSADSLFAIGDILYPRLTDEEIINRYIAVQVKSLQYRAKYNAALAKAYDLKKRLVRTPIIRAHISNGLAIAGLYEKLSRPDSLAHYVDWILEKSKGVIDRTDPTMSSIYRIAAISSMRNNDYEISEERFEKSLNIAEAALGKNSLLYAFAYGNLPVLYSAQGDYKKAIEHGIEAAALSERIGNIEGQAIFTTNVGIEYYYQGDFGRSIVYLQKGKDLKESLYGAGHNSVAGAYRLLGILHEVTGDYKKANDYYQSVLSTYKTSSDVPAFRLVEIYNSLSNFNMMISEYEQARVYSAKAIDLIKKEQGESHYDLSYNYLNMSTIMMNLQNAEESVRYSRLANHIEMIHRGDRTLEFALNKSNLAVAYSYLDRFNDAIIEVDKSLGILQHEGKALNMSKNGIYILDNSARVYNEIAKSEPNNNNIATYVKYIKKLIRYTDKYRTDFSDSFSKSGHINIANKVYKGVLEDIYDLYKLKKDARLIDISLELMESTKAAILKDVINENVIKFSSIPDSLKEQETALKDAYIALNNNYNEDLQNDSIREALEISRLSYNDFVDEHVLKNPKYFALRSDSIKLTIEEIQAEIENDEVVIEYFKEFNNYYGLKVGKDETGFYKLGAVAEVDSLVDVWQQLIRSRDDQINLVSQELHDILWAPLQLASELSRATVVPSGALWLLSFEALHDGETYLIEDYNIQYSLSLEVDRFVQRFRKGKNESLTIFAPGWEDDLKDSYKAVVSDSSLLDQEYLNILRQPWSLKLSKYLDDNFDIISYDQEKATETNFKSQAAATSILHFASHAVVNNEDPLRSKVHLAKDANTNDDGYLYAYEIFDMSLNADLAVLGACETGVGKMKEGEGMLSLSYAMQYAGCASTIMSLWKIDESSSTDIFSNFYKNLSEESKISDALHLSKLEFLQAEENVNLQHPYYWAGTVFMGLDHVVPIQPKTPSNNLLWIALGVIAILLLFWIFRRTLGR